METIFDYFLHIRELKKDEVQGKPVKKTFVFEGRGTYQTPSIGMVSSALINPCVTLHKRFNNNQLSLSQRYVPFTKLIPKDIGTFPSTSELERKRLAQNIYLTVNGPYSWLSRYR